MITNLYCLKDALISMDRPFMCPNDNAAVRSAAAAVNDPRQPFRENLNDMQLWRLGTFDDQTGAIESAPEFVCALASLYKRRDIRTADDIAADQEFLEAVTEAKKDA